MKFKIARMGNSMFSWVVAEPYVFPDVYPSENLLYVGTFEGCTKWVEHHNKKSPYKSTRLINKIRTTLSSLFPPK